MLRHYYFLPFISSDNFYVLKRKKSYLRATIYKKGAVPKIDYFKYEFFPTFFFFKAQLKYNSKNKFQTKRSWIDWVIPRQVSYPFLDPQNLEYRLKSAKLNIFTWNLVGICNFTWRKRKNYFWEKIINGSGNIRKKYIVS